jgi:hypothetical protein
LNWRDHLAALGALASAALIAARLLAISRYDPTTAATILQTAGTTTVLLGTALSLLPFVVVFVTCAIALAVCIDQTLFGSQLRIGPEILILAVGVSIMLLPALLCIPVLLFVVFAAAIGWRIRRRNGAFSFRSVVAGSRVLRVEVAVLAVCFVLTPVVLPQPWLPNEEVRLKDNSVLVGYVLGDLQGRVAVMSDRDRKIFLVDPADISDREFCAGPAQLGGRLSSAPRLTVHGSLLGSWLYGSDVPSYPRCPVEKRPTPK